MDNTNEKAIQILVEQIVKIVSTQNMIDGFYDKTVKAIYVKQIDDFNHKVEYNGVEYKVKKIGNNNNKTGDIVLLLLPCGSINNAIIVSEYNGVNDKDLNLNMLLAESILTKNGIQVPNGYLNKIFELSSLFNQNGMDKNYSMFFAILYAILLIK